MATHSNILAWKIPWTEEPGYSPWGLKESDMTEQLSLTRMYKWITLLYTRRGQIRSDEFAQLCPTLCDPMNRSMPGLPVHHQLPEFTETHVHRVSERDRTL